VSTSISAGSVATEAFLQRSANRGSDSRRARPEAECA